MGLVDRARGAWNAFVSDEESGNNTPSMTYGPVSSFRPDRPKMSVTNERSIISAIFTRMSIDASLVDIRHCRLDSADRYLDEINSGLNECLSVEANLDQSALALKLDIVSTILDKGVAAIVPVDTTLNPLTTGGFDIKTMRVGEVIQWYPKRVKVRLYNEAKGKRQDITLPKEMCAIVENPFYDVMNEPNSTMQRLTRKLNLLDAVDEQTSSGKLDMLIQLPYAVKSEQRRQAAEQRRKDLEFQLKGSQYGIGYTDSTEKVIQLNRSVENNHLKTIEYLTNLLYSQLGITAGVLDGTADEKTMLNYHARTIKPIVDAVIEAMRRAFLTKTARSQKQSILYFRDPFALVPLSDIAEIADKLARNEILSSNEIRQGIGYKPAADPKADELRNSNMPQSELGAPPPGAAPEATDEPQDPNLYNDAADDASASIDETLAILTPEEEDEDEEAFMAGMDDVDASIDEAFKILGEAP